MYECGKNFQIIVLDCSVNMHIVWHIKVQYRETVMVQNFFQ